MRYTHKPATPRTGVDRKADAINFVWCAMDHVIRATDADKIALMKGVTKASDIAEVRRAFDQRMARL